MLIRDRLSALLGVALVLCLSVFWLNPAQSGSKKKDRDRGDSFGFTESSLFGSYAASGYANGFQSRSIGVVEFDGNGGVIKLVVVNASNGEGGRRLIEVASTGTYTVNASGVGVMYMTDTFSSGQTNQTTMDFVINTNSSDEYSDGLLAQEITCLQREAGTTASLIEHSLTRRNLQVDHDD
ncbi:hypothetical protein OAH34_00935 [bacterium]|jgi:hypothetical protein|nr:hypothetical protein [Rubripirellula sp.]MDB4338481.1 hypothetical protein [Rubripirellula sp.]MDB4809739.1 hypothetical protein [bacterium]